MVITKNVLPSNVYKTVNQLKQDFHNTSDLSVRTLYYGEANRTLIQIIYIEGAINNISIEETIILPILKSAKRQKQIVSKDFVDYIAFGVLTSSSVETIDSYSSVKDAIIEGKTVILFDGYAKGLMIENTSWQERSLEESTGESNPLGMLVGFTEKAKTNINMLRGLIKSEQLCVKKFNIGTVSKTNIYLIYLNDLVDKKTLDEVNKKIEQIDIKYLIEGKIIEESILGNSSSLFPLSHLTERADVSAANMFEGRLVLMIDGIPQVYIFPSLFLDFFQGPVEYTTNYGRFSIRMLRFIGFLLSVYLPSIYVALDKFAENQINNKVFKALFTKDELLPTFWEILLLMFMFRLVIDASFRIPKSVVIFLAFIGPIIIGETAVIAKLIHPVGLITIGLATASTMLFGNKGLTAAINTLRLIFVLIAYWFGYMGLLIGTTTLILYIIQLHSLGVPYLSPFIPFNPKELKDSFYRGNLQKLINSKHRYPHNSE